MTKLVVITFLVILLFGCNQGYEELKWNDTDVVAEGKRYRAEPDNPPTYYHTSTSDLIITNNVCMAGEILYSQNAMFMCNANLTYVPLE